MNAYNYSYFRPGWSPFSVLAMVLGFLVFWPIGLAVLAWILWGERFGWAPGADWISRQKAWGGWCQNNRQQNWNERRSFGGGWGQGPSSGNAAFDAYRAEQLKRLDDERRRLDAEVSEFAEYLKSLHMARDREEFDRYMRERPARSNGNVQPTDDKRDIDI